MYYGDGAMLELVVAALVRLPTPVRYAVLCEAAIFGVGRSCAGWIGRALLLDRHAEGPSRLVVVSGAGTDDQLQRIVHHETAHLWLEPMPPASVCGTALTVTGELALYRMAAEQGWLEKVTGTIDRGELLAEALATVWERSP